MATVLIAEDDAMNREILARRLAHAGFTTVLAANGAEALDLAVATLPDVIVMDMRMPVLDGLTATRRLKALPATRHIPIIVLTANAFIDDREAAQAAGCDDFETKPIDFRRLIAKLERLANP
ncbi:MAG: response regulator [Kouleothrix sp.]|jgi:CheY-like chemotaxis protein|nr:response regulator [Kouleothrix sp.]